ncbi:hypothetical protein RO3G_15920 [Rhizopus delemar RA 99-880]|uniref:Uncharacterized protein n=1 Tax=Rhizopus delemar (strain RA 99-880 / ATCC MYA-4621 / FGSC 9543 / NRRL 43880) TaxID=246409 RepID=I1CRX9_RHIO9|nr:hypothetical protein RO3G_15920 [Rhizopus delemar RA 99-880]|eukprot:EIE91209.1 hypothetical protein RO3G_15920 [Rhizopus delemar RA 99-880]
MRLSTSADVNTQQDHNSLAHMRLFSNNQMHMRKKASSTSFQEKVPPSPPPHLGQRFLDWLPIFSH